MCQHIDVRTHVERLPYGLGSDYLAFYDATMVRFWFKNTECEHAIKECLSSIEGIRLLGDEELQSLGSLFPDRRYGEAIYLVDAGSIVAPSFFGSQEHLKGMHGYHPDAEEYDAFLGSAGVDVGDARHITDLCAIMRQELNLAEAKRTP